MAWEAPGTAVAAAMVLAPQIHGGPGVVFNKDTNRMVHSFVACNLCDRVWTSPDPPGGCCTHCPRVPVRDVLTWAGYPEYGSLNKRYVNLGGVEPIPVWRMSPSLRLLSNLQAELN